MPGLGRSTRVCQGMVDVFRKSLATWFQAIRAVDIVKGAESCPASKCGTGTWLQVFVRSNTSIHEATGALVIATARGGNIGNGASSPGTLDRDYDWLLPADPLLL